MNRLKDSTSPYLLQHADNPVDWWPWCDQAFEEAARRDVPVMLSIGYAACHWCHVMAHESFEDTETAALMNQLFVSIKVDREERPDIDEVYMASLHALGERGGWPLTMFLTPEGEPFWGGTYFPKTAQYGRPGFVTVLRSVAEAFRAEPDRIAQNVQSIREALAAEPRQEAGALSQDVIDTAAVQIARYIDPRNGGLRGAPKFPNTPILELLWRAGARVRETPMRDLVHLTLTRMAQGGIYDHLGGGFARYSTDERWLVPHFEKMLYDNAQLLEMLALCARAYGDALLKRRAQEIVAWLTREMTTEGGAFCASLDADSEGEEGKFYVWTWDELVAVLGEDDAGFFGAFYDASPEGNWVEEHHGKAVNVLNQLSAKTAHPEDEARLAPLKHKLFLARERRVHPGRDDKIMADWNGLMIAALVNAATALGEPQWASLAARAYGVVIERLHYRDQDGKERLAHSTRAGVVVKPGFALDHAAMLRAALALHEARRMRGADIQTRDYLADGIRFAEILRDDYRDAASGLLAMSAANASDVILRLAPTHDDAIPNAHPVFLQGLVKLAALTGEDSWLKLADSLFAAIGPIARASLFGHAGILNALDLRLNGREIVIAGPERQALYDAALAVPFDTRTVLDLDSAAGLPADHPAAAQIKAAGETAAAFLCSDGRCSLPAHDLAAFTTLIGV